MRPPEPLRFLPATLAALAMALLAACSGSGTPEPPKAPPRAALTVTAVTPRAVEWPMTVAASGSIAAWQEASISAEVAGLRVVEVLANVGDVVKKGDVLARMQSETVKNDVAQQRAALADAEASLTQASIVLERAKELVPSGSVSKRDLLSYETQERTAEARVASARALLASQELRLRQTEVVAPDDGTLSQRAATVGAVANPGVELFKLIRQNRLEWRAELRAQELGLMRPELKASVVLPGSSPIAGQVRQIAPTVDPVSRLGIVYVDLPEPGRLKPGMFLSGAIQRGVAFALIVPQESLVVRDGSYFAYKVGADNRVSRIGVTPGRRIGSEVEVVDGLTAQDRVVAAGAGFLNDGDVVKVVEAMPVPGKASPAKAEAKPKADAKPKAEPAK